MDGSEGFRAESRAQGPGLHEERRAIAAGVLALGTLACARCDAPVAPAERPMSLAEPLECPYCAHRGTVRDFLSLAPPTRPARVVVRVSRPATRIRRY
jgi:hypothetical protein